MTTSVMTVDAWVSRALNLPVSRGPINARFLRQLVRHESLKVQALQSGYEATFPLTGLKRARRILGHICSIVGREDRLRIRSPKESFEVGLSKEEVT